MLRFGSSGSETTLEISYLKSETVYRSKPNWNDISITYREDPELSYQFYPDYYHFGGVDSPDEENVAVWHQDPNRGDNSWLEDCLQLIRNKYDPNVKLGESCSFIGITGDNLRRKWSTAKRLSVSYPPGTKVTKADPKWNDVTITYAEDPKLQKY